MERKRISSRLLTEHRTWPGAWSPDTEIMTRPKSRVGHLTNGATQPPHLAFFFWWMSHIVDESPSYICFINLGISLISLTSCHDSSTGPNHSTLKLFYNGLLNYFISPSIKSTLCISTMLNFLFIYHLTSFLKLSSHLLWAWLRPCPQWSLIHYDWFS